MGGKGWGWFQDQVSTEREVYESRGVTRYEGIKLGGQGVPISCPRIFGIGGFGFQHYPGWQLITIVLMPRVNWADCARTLLQRGPGETRSFFSKFFPPTFPTLFGLSVDDVLPTSAARIHIDFAGIFSPPIIYDLSSCIDRRVRSIPPFVQETDLHQKCRGSIWVFPRAGSLRPASLLLLMALLGPSRLWHVVAFRFSVIPTLYPFIIIFFFEIDRVLILV